MSYPSSFFARALIPCAFVGPETLQQVELAESCNLRTKSSTSAQAGFEAGAQLRHGRVCQGLGEGGALPPCLSPATATDAKNEELVVVHEL